MAKEPLSAKTGTLYIDSTAAALGTSEITAISNWRVNRDPGIRPYGANDTDGCRSRISGMHDATGTFDVYVSVGSNPPIEPGDIVFARFNVDNTGLNYYQAEIMIGPQDVSCEIGPDGAEIVQTYEWGARSRLVPYGILAKGVGGSSSSGA